MSEHLQAFYEDFQRSIGNPHGGVDQILSLRGGKQIDLKQTAGGEKYVLRRYSPSAISKIAGTPRAFTRKMAATKEAFEANGIQLVEHLLIKDAKSTEFPITIVTAYIEEQTALQDAQPETKRRIAKSLGNLATDPDQENDIFITAAMIMPDMFHVGTGDEYSESVTLVDIDPRVTEIGAMASWIQRSMMAASVLRAANVLWDNWVAEDERRFVFPGLTIEAARSLDRNCGIDDALFRTVASVNLMDNGVDYREMALAPN